MVPREIGDFFRRFKVPVNEEEEFYKFRNRVIGLIEPVVYIPFRRNSETRRLFSLLVGTNDNDARSLLDFYFGNADNLYELLQNLELLAAALVVTELKESASHLYQAVSTALGLSPLIDVRVAKTEEGFIFYPIGAEDLDKAIVEGVLNWIADYPKANVAYVGALKLYQSKDRDVYRNLLDNLRVSVEELLRAILGNYKSLENQKNELLGWLKNQGVNQKIITSFQQFLFGPYQQLQNDDVKHGNFQFSEPEIEHILYMTGSILRFLIEVRRQGDDE